MKFAKDSMEPATQRDIRETQAMLLAGFECCFEMISTVIHRQEGVRAFSNDQLEREVFRVRENVLKVLEERMAKYLPNNGK